MADGKLKVWCHIIEDKKRGKEMVKQKVGAFTVTVGADVNKKTLDEAIKAEYKKIKQRQVKIKDLGIGEDVK